VQSSGSIWLKWHAPTAPDFRDPAKEATLKSEVSTGSSEMGAGASQTDSEALGKSASERWPETALTRWRGGGFDLELVER
jgi:hypothetical protein